jgi:hypothetical protein
MTRRLQQMVACWFVLQIVLPFTAPLQSLELRDLFGDTHHHRTTRSPESTTTPTIGEAAPVDSVSLLTSTAMNRSESSFVSPLTSIRGPLTSAYTLLAAPQVQRSVLRL